MGAGFSKRSRPHLKACNDSWFVDETYIKIRKTWMYLYWAVDSEGNTLEFLLSPTRDAEAAKHFFLKALHAPAGSTPQAHPFEELCRALHWGHCNIPAPQKRSGHRQGRKLGEIPTLPVLCSIACIEGIEHAVPLTIRTYQIIDAINNDWWKKVDTLIRSQRVVPENVPVLTP